MPETDATDPFESAVPPHSVRPEASSSRPPRPEMSDRTPAPVLQPIVPTRQVKWARTLWLLSFAAGSIALLFAFVSREQQLNRLRELVTELAPERDAETLAALASLVFWGTLALVTLIIVIQAILLRAMVRGHGGARWALMFSLFIGAAISLIADAVAIPPGDDGLYLRICLVVQLVFGGVGLVLSLFPGASAWFRSLKEARRSQRV